jgi:uncharacterized protein YkvS
MEELCQKGEAPRSEEELLVAMNHAGDLITPQDCLGYVSKVNDNCFQCAHHGKDYFDN